LVFRAVSQEEPLNGSFASRLLSGEFDGEFLCEAEMRLRRAIQADSMAMDD
jgi:hypothetical protein